jgi:hypothetical protein
MFFSLLSLVGLVLVVFFVFVAITQIAHPRREPVTHTLLTVFWLIPACVTVFLTLTHAYYAFHHIGFWDFLLYCFVLAITFMVVCISLNNIDGKNGPPHRSDDPLSHA